MSYAVKINECVSWVGALDRDIEVFDVVMRTEYGTSYNSYLIKGSEKTVLIEAAKETFFSEHIDRIKSICDVEDIDYIVVNHTEPDHSGAIKKLIEINPNITVVGSTSAIKFLSEIVNGTFSSLVVKEGDYLDLGDKSLKFISAPFLHWPDSMYTYLEEDKILFTCDSFGCHYCDDRIFNDLIEGDFIDAYKYYFDCILAPFKDYMLRAINKIEKLDIDIICPGHGPVLRTDIQKYIDLYKKWCEKPILNQVVVSFVSAYGYTKKIAYKIAEAIEKSGINVKIFDLETADIGEVLGETAVSKGIVVGSPTILDDALPPVWNYISSLNPVINKGLVAGAFGSYGWNGCAVSNIEQRFNQLRFKMPAGTLKINLNPSKEQLLDAFEYGEKIAENLK